MSDDMLKQFEENFQKLGEQAMDLTDDERLWLAERWGIMLPPETIEYLDTPPKDPATAFGHAFVYGIFAGLLQAEQILRIAEENEKSGE